MPSADELKKKDRIISFYHLCYRIERERLLLGMKGDLNYEEKSRFASQVVRPVHLVLPLRGPIIGCHSPITKVVQGTPRARARL